MHLRPLVVLIVLALLGPAAATASAAKVKKLKPWAASNSYLVKADTDGRVAPKLEPRAKVNHIRTGQWVRVQCQTAGEAAYGSNLWVKVGRYYVPDAMLKTYTDGRLAGAPECGPGPNLNAPSLGAGELSSNPGGYGSYSQTYDLGTRFRSWTYGEMTGVLKKNFSRYFPFKGCGKTIRVGQRCELEAPGPNGPVRVTKITKHGFQLISLDGHPEGGGRSITFRFRQYCSPSSDYLYCDYKYLLVDAWGPVSKASIFGPLNAATVARHYWTNFGENIRNRYPRCPAGKGWIPTKRYCAIMV